MYMLGSTQSELCVNKQHTLYNELCLTTSTYGIWLVAGHGTTIRYDWLIVMWLAVSTITWMWLQLHWSVWFIDPSFLTLYGSPPLHRVHMELLVFERPNDMGPNHGKVSEAPLVQDVNGQGRGIQLFLGQILNEEKEGGEGGGGGGERKRFLLGAG